MWKQFLKQFLNEAIENVYCIRAMLCTCAVSNMMVEPAQMKCLRLY